MYICRGSGFDFGLDFWIWIRFQFGMLEINYEYKSFQLYK